LTVVAVVLAGGASRRFGTDKLAAALDAHTLLDHTLAGLPEAYVIIVVGPERRLLRPASFVREEPPGGGPTAGLIAGLRAALRSGPDAIVVLPGDAPAAGHGTQALLAALSADKKAVVAVDAVGQVQPLQLALRPDAARRLIELAGPEEGAGQSARRLVASLDPPPRRVTLEPAALFDIDTPEALEAWRLIRGDME
jgi:molybdopterin-guanine dinucleotide biosynthesis protein A